MKTLSTHQLYKGLNNRFDRRAALLIRFGFKYATYTQGMACFTRPRPLNPHASETIPASVLHHACNQAWIDTLAQYLRRW